MTLDGVRQETTSLLPQQHAVDLVMEIDDVPLLSRLTTPNVLPTTPNLSIRKVTEEEADPQWQQELLIQLQMTIPMVATYLLEYLPAIICIVLVGHIDSPDTKLYVDAATMSSTFTNVSAISIGFGLSSALDTLCSQAHGAGQYKKMGVYLQSGLLVVGVWLLPIFLLNWHTEYFLLFLGQDAQVAQLAGEFSKITVFGIPFLFLYEMCRKLMQAQNIVQPLVVMMMIGNVVNVVGGYYLTYTFGYGFQGAAWSRSLGYMILPVCMTIYMMWSRNYKSWWGGWDLTAALAQVHIFLTLGIPGLLMMAMEWWAYEILALFSGWLPDSVEAMSVHAVLMNVSSTLFMVFLGISVSANILVGNALGANRPKKAKMISQIAILMVMTVGGLLATGLFGFRYDIPTLLINDPAAIDRAATTLLVLLPFEVIDGTNAVVQGIYRGIGHQHMAAQTNAIAFYLIGVPLAAFLAFRLNVGVTGLWLGFGSGVSTALIVCTVVLSRRNWQQLADEAQLRLQH